MFERAQGADHLRLGGLLAAELSCFDSDHPSRKLRFASYPPSGTLYDRSMTSYGYAVSDDIRRLRSIVQLI